MHRRNLPKLSKNNFKTGFNMIIQLIDDWEQANKLLFLSYSKVKI